ncbi:MAG: hypothetical protein HY335_08010 [Deinococcus sp.]|nr:hypothetical protein [Deinococcus sp.]
MLLVILIALAAAAGGWAVAVWVYPGRDSDQERELENLRAQVSNLQAEKTSLQVQLNTERQRATQATAPQTRVAPVTPESSSPIATTPPPSTQSTSSTSTTPPATDTQPRRRREEAAAQSQESSARTTQSPTASTTRSTTTTPATTASTTPQRHGSWEVSVRSTTTNFRLPSSSRGAPPGDTYLEVVFTITNNGNGQLEELAEGDLTAGSQIIPLARPIRFGGPFGSGESRDVAYYFQVSETVANAGGTVNFRFADGTTLAFNVRPAENRR